MPVEASASPFDLWLFRNATEDYRTDETAVRGATENAQKGHCIRLFYSLFIILLSEYRKSPLSQTLP